MCPSDQTTAQLPAGSRLSRWALKPERRNSPSTWKVCPPAPSDRQTNARAAGQWIPQFVGGLTDLDGSLAHDEAPFIYLTTQGELPELYATPFAEMQKYSIITDAPPCELSSVAQAPGTRAVEYKRPTSPAGTWRVRVYVENCSTAEFDAWCLNSESALWARPMTQDTPFVRMPDVHLDELMQCAKLGRSDRAHELIAEITATGGVPDQFAWSALLSACAKSDLASMRSVMHEMAEHGVLPNAHGFNAVTGAFSKAGQPESIQKMILQMKEAGVAMNVYVFTSLVAAYGKSGRPVDASHVLEDMRTEGVQPNVATYNALISAWCKGSSEQTLPAHTALRQADNVLQQMQQAGLRPDTFTYTALMAGYLQAGDPHTALAMVQKMEADGLQADETSTTVAEEIHQALRQADGQPKLAQKVSEHKRYKGSRAATGAERSQVVSQWRTPEATTNSCRDTHSSRERTVCRQYLASGSCMRGDACKFLHKAADGSVDQAKDTNNSTASSTRIGRLTRNHSTPSPSRIGQEDTHSSPEECGNWRTTGKCQYDNKCRYSHDEPKSKLARARTSTATVAAGPPTGSSWRNTAQQQPCQADRRRQQVHEAAEACVANTWTAICHKSQPTNQAKTTEPVKVAEMRVACSTCGNSFAATDETSFQQHQEKCANKGNKCKLAKRNNNWTKVKGTRGHSRRCATARA